MTKTRKRNKPPAGWERWTSDTGQLVMVHSKERCSGVCAIHNPSEHRMKSYPRYWRDDRGLMERICPCGVGHPDLDHINFIRMMFGDKEARIENIHGCCGCCAVLILRR